jgi:hypothetical protein
VLGALSPDGKQVLFHEGGKGGGALSTIFLRKTDGTSAVRLGEGYGIALSPDQKWVLASIPTNPPRYLLVPTGAGESLEFKLPGIENIALQGFAADSRRIVFMGNEPGHKVRIYLFDPASSKLEPLAPEGTRGTVSPDGKFILERPENGPVQLMPLETRTLREIKGLQEKDRLLQVSADGASVLVANPNGMTAAVYRVTVQSGDRKLIKTLEMHDPTGGFGITRVAATPDGQSFAYNTLRQLSELYLLQGLH